MKVIYKSFNLPSKYLEKGRLHSHVNSFARELYERKCFPNGFYYEILNPIEIVSVRISPADSANLFKVKFRARVIKSIASLIYVESVMYIHSCGYIVSFKCLDDVEFDCNTPVLCCECDERLEKDVSITFNVTEVEYDVPSFACVGEHVCHLRDVVRWLLDITLFIVALRLRLIFDFFLTPKKYGGKKTNNTLTKTGQIWNDNKKAKRNDSGRRYRQRIRMENNLRRRRRSGRICFIARK